MARRVFFGVAARVTLSALCAMAVGILLTAVPAMAAPPEVPQEEQVTEITTTTALLSGVLDPGGSAEASSYAFVYAPGSECKGMLQQEPGGVSTGKRKSVDATVTDLLPATTYTFCLVARNASSEESAGSPVTFTTGPPEFPAEEQATEITSTTARLSGALDPRGKGEAGSYAFVYTASHTECKGTSQQELGGISTGENQSVDVTVTDLLPETTYTFCLVARNASSEESAGAPVTFTTGTSVLPVVEKEAAASIGNSTETASASIDPGGLSTGYHLEYVTEAQFGSHGWAEATQVPVPDAALPAGSDGFPVSEQLSGLQPGTAYRFRFSATNALGMARGGDVTFTTPSAAASASALPDNRVYELVSVTDNPGDVYVPASARHGSSPDITTHYPFRASADGDALAYVGFPGYSGGNGFTGEGTGNQFLATRDPVQGWKASDITPEATGGGEEIRLSAYEYFSSELSFGVLGAEWSRAFAESANPPGPAQCGALYARDASGYHALFSEAPAPFACGAIGTFGDVREQDQLFAGASADGSQLLFQTPAALVAQAKAIPEISPREGNNLYDSTGGRLSLVNVLPGEAAPVAVYGGPPHSTEEEGFPGDFSNVISEDGTKIFWTDLLTQRIYMRENAAQPPSPITGGHCAAPEDACTVAVSTGPAQYWTATPNGEYVYYTENGELWRFDTSDQVREAIVISGVNGENAGVKGVIGAGSDGSYVYFVAEGELSATANYRGEVATPGTENLYVLHIGQKPTYIAAAPEGWQPDMGQRTVEATPDGRHLVFESTQQLTGYDNTALAEEGSGLEVFVYSAEPTGPGQLFCASCDPEGAPPTTGLPDGGGGGPHLSPSMHPTFMPRWISDDGGRVFFDSSEPLASNDKNGIQDVYEWEREGVGTCAVEASPRPDGGCVFLLSGGDSTDYSYFLDADATGANAFFIHRGRLGQTAPDNEKAEVLDARENGGFPQISLACTGTGCQGVPPALPIFATPATFTFDGPSDASPPPPSKPKTAAQIRAEQLAKALRSCQQKKSKRMRAQCKTRARARYGVKASKVQPARKSRIHSARRSDNHGADNSRGAGTGKRGSK